MTTRKRSSLWGGDANRTMERKERTTYPAWSLLSRSHLSLFFCHHIDISESRDTATLPIVLTGSPGPSCSPSHQRISPPTRFALSERPGSNSNVHIAHSEFTGDWSHCTKDVSETWKQPLGYESITIPGIRRMIALPRTPSTRLSTNDNIENREAEASFSRSPSATVPYHSDNSSSFLAQRTPHI